MAVRAKKIQPAKAEAIESAKKFSLITVTLFLLTTAD